MTETLVMRDTVQSECLAEALEKPSLDDRIYRVVRLPNGLEALLIHDPDTDKASAALDVNTGAFSDAKDMPGMAHAVEHLLFMGTEKYPEENEYNRYLAANSGHSNAFTAATSTNYYFEVASRLTTQEVAITDIASTPAHHATSGLSPLHGALDRFAQFFIAPLFLEDTLDRELKAVDSENKKNLQSDTWRLHQLGKSLANPNHPYNHFSTGNLKTLRDDPLGRGVRIRDRFIDFHTRQYSANRMKLVVLGRESLDTLQEWTENFFAEVPNKNLPQNRWDGISPYTEKELLTETRAKPVMETRSLDITFPFMDEEHLFDSQPGRYLSHLIGHEGPGSVLAYIKAKGWANGLSAGESDICPGSALFSIHIKLTPDGLKNYKEVIKIVFQYIAILRETPPQKWIFDEIKGITEVDFRFRQKASASRTTSHLAGTMQRPIPRDRLLSASSVIKTYEPELISRALSYLNPDNFRITVVSQDPLEAPVQHEHWYGTEYTTEQLPEDFLSAVRMASRSTAAERPTDLFLPAVNEFIPSKLEVEKRTVSEPSKTPKLIRNEKFLRLWHKKDDQFWVPQAHVNLLLRNPVCSTTPRNMVIASLFAELVQDSLAEYAYSAEIAGLEYNLVSTASGFGANVKGYNDKLPVLFEKVLVSMRDLEVDVTRFEIIRERLTRSYRNSEYIAPFQQISQYSRWLGSEKGWIIGQYLEELQTIDADDVRAFKPLLLGQMHIELLVDGNMYHEDALKLGDLVESTFRSRPLPASQWPVKRAIMLPEGSNYQYLRPLKDPSNVNHCIDYLLYVGDKTNQLKRAQLILFAQMTHEPAFNQLRTKEQLGYVVFSGYVTHITSSAYHVLIQSERSPEHLENRIDQFLTDFSQKLSNMSTEEFESHRHSVINEKLEKLKNLGQESNRFWNQVSSEFYHFEEIDEEVKHLRQITKADMIAFFAHHIDPSSATRAKMSVHLVAQNSFPTISQVTSGNELQAKVLTVIQQFLNTLGLDGSSERLHEHFKDTDFTRRDQASLLKSFTAYLHDLNVPAQLAATAIEQAKSLIATVLPALSVENPVPEGQVTKASSSKAILIEDVHLFKASMQLSSGARPVKDLSFYESLEPKL